MMVQHTSPYRRPNVVMGRAPIQGSNAPAPVDWASILQSNIEAHGGLIHDLIRVKQTKFNDRGVTKSPYVIKNTSNRVRIHVTPDSSTTTAEVNVWYMGETNPGLPYKPNYIDDKPDAHQVFPYNTQMQEMVDFIVKHLSAETTYSIGNQSRILVSSDLTVCGKTYQGPKQENVGKPIFFYGLITNSLRQASGNWKVDLRPEHGNPVSVELDGHSVQFKPTADGILIYSSEYMAAVVLAPDFQRYYEVV